jgi:ubiquinone/menaquinone biosynthesis C-methylase UbiE
MQQQLVDLIGQTDIYILDQIIKGRYKHSDIILDAGCGHGRNMHWFVQSKMDVFGTDADATALAAAAAKFPTLHPSKLIAASCDALPFANEYFHHIICSAVLHFAKSEQHFLQMMHELIRVLKPGGSLLIRMASVFGMEHLLTTDANGHSILPDGTQRFLLNTYLKNEIMKQLKLQLAEPVKTTIVHGQRCMTTLVLSKW